MHVILSIDLAYRKIENFGVCLIGVQGGRPTEASFPSAKDIGIDPADHKGCARAIAAYCGREGIHILFLDGPQGWKDPNSELTFRRCEKIARAPFKTGGQGVVTPGPSKPFVEFSIGLFAALEAEGSARVTEPVIQPPREGLLAVESFPTSAWRKLFMTPLPSRGKARESDISGRLYVLEKLFGFCAESVPSHDEVQALVAGLAGVAILAGDANGYIVEGEPPKKVGGVTVEGFIVNPRLNPGLA
jgi:hypothetical protein